MKRIQQGFTLIELMIVVAIIGILAAVALPAYQDYTARAQMSEAMTLTAALKTQVTEYYAQTGECPGNGKNGVAAATSIAGTYVKQTDITDGAGPCKITATLKDKPAVSGELSAKKLSLKMTDKSGSYVWECVSDAEQKLLPKACTKGTI